jgi:hypothetical protein
VSAPQRRWLAHMALWAQNATQWLLGAVVVACVVLAGMIAK